jgi:hypothetical protein
MQVAQRLGVKPGAAVPYRLRGQQCGALESKNLDLCYSFVWACALASETVRRSSRALGVVAIAGDRRGQTGMTVKCDCRHSGGNFNQDQSSAQRHQLPFRIQFSSKGLFVVLVSSWGRAALTGTKEGDDLDSANQPVKTLKRASTSSTVSRRSP